MKNLLMKYKEPSDSELATLMVEVANDAKTKAMIQNKRLKEVISNHIFLITQKSDI